jgi:hypothetical protein
MAAETVELALDQATTGFQCTAAPGSLTQTSSSIYVAHTLTWTLSEPVAEVVLPRVGVSCRFLADDELVTQFRAKAQADDLMVDFTLDEIRARLPPRLSYPDGGWSTMLPYRLVAVLEEPTSTFTLEVWNLLMLAKTVVEPHEWICAPRYAIAGLEYPSGNTANLDFSPWPGLKRAVQDAIDASD